MANRISKVMTRTGDSGQTGLADGSRVSKSSLRICAIGEVDELNSLLGLVISLKPDSAVADCLQNIQQLLFSAGGELAMPDRTLLQDGDVLMLEEWLAVFNEKLPPLKDFILPGGSVAGAQIHVARSVCRRVERSLVALSETEKVSDVLLRFFNRLSDLLFVLARTENRCSGHPETFWKKK